MKKNFILAGVGGQGTVLASKLLAKAFMDKGETAHTAETIGMAQRGGCVVSHVRIGKSFAPLIPMKTADFIIGFEPSEALRCIDYLKDNGIVVVSSKTIKPVTASLSGTNYDGVDVLESLKANVKNLLIIDGDEICNQCGSAKVLNVALLGAVSKFTELGITYDELKQALIKTLPEKILKMNLKALELGSKQ